MLTIDTNRTEANATYLDYQLFAGNLNQLPKRHKTIIQYLKPILFLHGRKRPEV